MQSPIIIEGEPFDWEEGARAMDRMAEDQANGEEFMWRDAFAADPGVIICPNPDCKTHYWREGTVVECRKCGTQWEVR